MGPAYKTVQQLNSIVLFFCDVLAFACGAGVIVAACRWLADMLPIIERLRLF